MEKLNKLKKGDRFKIKKNGRYYFVTDRTIRWCIATSQGVNYAFDLKQIVFI